MRIAITTFFQSQTNYGQLLQAYALQQVLMQMGHFPYIIRYGFHKRLQSKHGMDYPDISFSKLLSNNKSFSAIPGTKENRQFDTFRTTHLNLSDNAYNTIEELQMYPPIADCYLTGSDQVWAQLLNDSNNRTFFLDFGFSFIRRIAYAPSFSLKCYPPELNHILADNLKRLDAISAREKAGVEICKNAGYEAEWVVDPTMLLDDNYYRQMAMESSTELPNNYMLAYHVNVSKEDLACWTKFNNYNVAHSLCAIAVHANGESTPDIEFLENADYLYPNIQDWIRLIDHCEYMLTTSFHGVVFSILLRKPFFVVLNRESTFAGNNRITEILSELGLTDRIVTSNTYIEDKLSKSIDWDSVDEKVKLLRSRSLTFLKDNLFDNKEKASAKLNFGLEWVMQYVIQTTNRLVEQNGLLLESINQKKHIIKELQEQFDEKHRQLDNLQAQLVDCQHQLQNCNNRLECLSRKNSKHLKLCRILGICIVVILVFAVIFALFA